MPKIVLAVPEVITKITIEWKHAMLCPFGPASNQMDSTLWVFSRDTFEIGKVAKLQTQSERFEDKVTSISRPTEDGYVIVGFASKRQVQIPDRTVRYV